MLTIEEIKKRLHGLNYAEVARNTGFTRAYISAIANGKHFNPRYETVKALSDYLENHK